MKSVDPKHKIIYLAIIFTLMSHAILLAVFYFIPLHQEDEEEYVPVDVETIDREEIPELDELLELHQEEGQQLRNVIASAESEKTHEVRSYNRRSEEEVQREIEERLKNIEKEVIDDLREQGKGFDEEKFQKKSEEQNEELDTYDYINQNKTSYSNATVEYDLAGRDNLKLPIPAYKCIGSGTVVVRIEVDREGTVENAEIDEIASMKASDCHREQALAYAQRSLFFNKSDAPKKQVGTITYRFFAQ